jgi:hypothetical protein
MNKFPFLFFALLGFGMASASGYAQESEPIERIETQRRELGVKQVLEKGRLVKDLLQKATAAGDLTAVTTLQQQLDQSAEAFRRLQDPSSGGSSKDSATDATQEKLPEAIQNVQGRKWFCKASPGIADAHIWFEGRNLILEDTDGKISKYSAEPSLPGAFRCTSGTSVVYLIFDATQNTGFISMQPAESPGTLIGK